MITGLTALCLLVAAIVYAYFFIFSRSMSLDEGYLMITIQGFNSGHALYDSVFTQYGPLYYFYEWFLRAVLSVPLTHDATRFLSVMHWLLAAVVLGFAAWRITRSAFAALFVAAQGFIHLAAIANEPGHPQELVVLLLALGILIAARFSPSRWTIECLAVLTALLAFTKINVGVFFGFALLLALRCHSSDRFSRGRWNWLWLIVSGILPFVLMRRHLDAEWCRNFATVAAATTMATLFVVQRVSGERNLGIKKYFTASAAFGFAAVILLGATLWLGTSWKGLLDGLFLTPLKMPRVALLAIVVSGAALANALASAGCAALLVPRRDDARLNSLLNVLKALYGIVGAFCLMGEAKAQLAYLLPWVWLVAVPGGKSERDTGENFARVLLGVAAAWQSLQAYPIAGTQVTLATFLLVLSYGICLHDSLRAAAQTRRVPAWLASLTPGRSILTQALAALSLVFFFANVWCHLPDLRREHARLRPLELPGSAHVRMDDETVRMYRGLAQYLATESSTFVTYPGVNSLYFWSDKRPPTQLNSTGWGQLTHPQQREILDALAKAERPRLVIVEAMMQNWDSAACDPIRPLIRFVAEECRPLGRMGRFIIFEPKTKADSTARLSAIEPASR
ncbi:MAG TPA: hypothetical protein VGF13_23280 [Verrucomicrobiae bacterium]